MGAIPEQEQFDLVGRVGWIWRRPVRYRIRNDWLRRATCDAPVGGAARLVGAPGSNRFSGNNSCTTPAHFTSAGYNEEMQTMETLTLTLHKTKDTKNKVVYGTKDGDVIQSVYIDKDALGDVPPATLQVVITPQ